MKKNNVCLPTTLSLIQVATVARNVESIVGIDSGLTHLAIAARNAAGFSADSNLVIYGSTDPQRTGPRNSTSIYDERPKCWPCYKKECKINTPCLESHLSLVLKLMK